MIAQRLSKMAKHQASWWLPAVIILTLSACTTSTDLSDAEKSILVTELDFADFGGEQGAVSGRFEKTIDHINRATEFTYQTPDESDIYIVSTVSVERSAADALASEVANKAGILIGLRSAGVIDVPIEMTKPYGSRSSLSVLKKDGKPIGNMLHAVLGKKIVLLVFSGIYFDTEAGFRELMDAKMKHVSEFGSS